MLLQEQQAALMGRLRAAHKDNDTIYLETIPQSKTLPPPGRHLLVKTAELTDLSKTSVIGAPLFQRVLIFLLFEHEPLVSIFFAVENS